MNLRDAARDKECLVRIPGTCRGDCETTVLAHVRIIGISGMGYKAPDLLGAWACYPCHMAIDGQLETTYTADELELMHLRGVMRTLDRLLREGLVKC